jgi:radical SAM superfamily enzyme YgiQ (UPF0313 family)
MKIVLIALYNVHSYAIRGFHSLLLEHGADVESMYFKSSTYEDSPAADIEIKDFVRVLASKKPDCAAISVHSPVFPVFKRMATMIKTQMPGVKIMVGGEHPTADPESCKAYADCVVAGEGEQVMLRLAGGEVPDGVCSPDAVTDMDSLPPSYYGFKTLRFGGRQTLPPISSYATGRGCPYRCTYCQESVRPSAACRRKSVDKVISDLRYLQKHGDMKEVFFSDSIFTLNHKWLEEFCQKFPPLGMRFGCYGHSAGLTPEVITMLRDAGLGNFRMGVQSGSKYIRSLIFNRKDSLAEIMDSAWLLHRSGVKTTYDFIVNNPYDTADTLRETRDFIADLPPGVGINNFELRWFPATPLTRKALKDQTIRQQDVEGQSTRLGSWNYLYTKEE